MNSTGREMRDKKKQILAFIIVALVIALPAVSFAQGAGNRVCPEIDKAFTSRVENIPNVLCRLSALIKTVIPILVLLGIMYFVWGVVHYVIGDSEEAKKKGKDAMIFGVIGFVAIFALWGLVSAVIYTLGIEQPGNTIIRNFVDYNKSFLGTGGKGGGCGGELTDKNLKGLIDYVTCLITSSVIPLLLALAMAFFVWGVVQYVINDTDEGKKKKGRDFMIWGIIGLAVMVGVWGLVAIVGGTFGIKYAIPQVNVK